MKLEQVIQRDTRALQPLATEVPIGTLYYVTDEFVTERSDGTVWESFTDAGSIGVVDFTDLADVPTDYTGDSLKVLRINAAETAIEFVTPAVDKRTVGIVIDGGGVVLTTGLKGFIRVPYAGTITKWTLLPDQSGSIVMDIWKDTYANHPPVVGDTITAAAKPTISAATKAESSTLTGWTTTITAGDILAFNVDSVTTITRVILELEITI